MTPKKVVVAACETVNVLVPVTLLLSVIVPALPLKLEMVRLMELRSSVPPVIVTALEPAVPSAEALPI